MADREEKRLAQSPPTIVDLALLVEVLCIKGWVIIWSHRRNAN